MDMHRDGRDADDAWRIVKGVCSGGLTAGARHNGIHAKTGISCKLTTVTRANRGAGRVSDARITECQRHSLKP